MTSVLHFWRLYISLDTSRKVVKLALSIEGYDGAQS